MPLNQTERQRGAKAKVASDASPPTRWPILSPASVKFWGGHEHRQHSLIREAFIEHLVHTGTLEELRTGSDHLDLEEQGLGRRASRHRPAAEGAGSSQAPRRRPTARSLGSAPGRAPSLPRTSTRNPGARSPQTQGPSLRKVSLPTLHHAPSPGHKANPGLPSPARATLPHIPLAGRPLPPLLPSRSPERLLGPRPPLPGPRSRPAGPSPPPRPGNPSSAPPRPHYLFDRGAIADHDLLLVLGGLDGDPNGGPRLGPARLRHAAAAATRPPASPLRLLLLLLPARPAGPARLGSGASNTPLPSLPLGFTAPSGPAAATAPRADWGGHCSGVRPGPSPGSRSRVWAPGRLGAGAGRALHCAGAGRAPAGALGPSRRARAVPRSTPAQSGPCPLRGSLPLRDKGLCVAALSPFRAIAGLSREAQLLPRLGLLPTGG